jgi:hypothetical protein
VEHDGDRNHHDATEILQARVSELRLVPDSGVRRNRGVDDLAFAFVLFYRVDGPDRPCCDKMIRRTNTDWIAIMDRSLTRPLTVDPRIITTPRCSEQDADETDAQHRS